MKERLFQFMQGRYGVDQLNNVLIIISIIFFIKVRTSIFKHSFQIS